MLFYSEALIASWQCVFLFLPVLGMPVCIVIMAKGRLRSVAVDEIVPVINVMS